MSGVQKVDGKKAEVRSITVEKAGGRRIYNNSAGDWAKCEKHCKDASTYAKVVQELVADLAKASVMLQESLHLAYLAAPRVESLFYDSPVSPGRVAMMIRANMKKAGIDGIRDIITDNDAIKGMDDVVADGVNWIKKLK